MPSGPLASACFAAAHAAYKSLGNTAQDLAMACFTHEQAVKENAPGMIEIIVEG